MDFPEYRCRQRPVSLWVAAFLLTSAGLVSAQPLVHTSMRWQASFPNGSNTAEVESTAVPLANGELVTIIHTGADPRDPSLRVGQKTVSANLRGHDPVSRLGFFRVDGPEAAKPMNWLPDVGSNADARCSALAPNGTIPCQTRGWIKQIRGKVLPLALLRVDFNVPPPPPGTPLVDDKGRVLALIFQALEGENSAYAIPSQAVLRVHHDIRTTGRLQRGWLGLALHADRPNPQIMRVLPDSPAARAGIRQADQLVSVGPHAINSYADAANAFFYLIPGQPVTVQLLRDGNRRSLSLTPTTAPDR